MFYNFDERSQEEIDQQSQFIQNLSQRNMQNLVTKSPLKKQYHIIQKQTFENDWYVQYTDNFNGQNFQSNQTILTIHGCPGNYEDWTSIEGVYGGFSRWINFFVPGFDGESEIRGDYKGNIQDICLLINKLLDKKKIQKITLLVHSMGGFIYSYYSNFHKDRIAGTIYMAAPPSKWFLGYTVFYGISQQIRNSDNLSDPKNRQQALKDFIYNQENLYFQINEKQILLPDLTENEICAFSKFCNSFNDISILFTYLQNPGNYLKLLISGNTDPLNDKDKTEEQFFQFLKQKTFVQNKDQLKKYLISKNLNINGFDFDNIQNNFVFCFENTGHNVHKKRAKYMKNILQLYISCIDFIEQYKMAKL